MAMTMHVDIVSAEGAIHSGTAEMIYAPAIMGEIGVAPRHSQFISRLNPGDVRIDTGDGNIEHYYVSGGIIEVQPNVVTILADTAVRAKDLDEAAALEAKRRAEDALDGKIAQYEYAKAQSELLDAVAQLRTIDRLRRQY